MLWSLSYKFGVLVTKFDRNRWKSRPGLLKPDMGNPGDMVAGRAPNFRKVGSKTQKIFNQELANAVRFFVL